MSYLLSKQYTTSKQQISATSNPSMSPLSRTPMRLSTKAMMAREVLLALIPRSAEVVPLHQDVVTVATALKPPSGDEVLMEPGRCATLVDCITPNLLGRTKEQIRMLPWDLAREARIFVRRIMLDNDDLRHPIRPSSVARPTQQPSITSLLCCYFACDLAIPMALSAFLDAIGKQALILPWWEKSFFALLDATICTWMVVLRSKANESPVGLFIRHSRTMDMVSLALGVFSMRSWCFSTSPARSTASKMRQSFVRSIRYHLFGWSGLSDRSRTRECICCQLQLCGGKATCHLSISCDVLIPTNSRSCDDQGETPAMHCPFPAVPG